MKKAIYLTLCLAGSVLFSLNGYAQYSHEFEWAKQIASIDGFNMPCDVAGDLSGNIISTGMFSNNHDFDPGPGTFILSTQQYYERDIFVQKLDGAGNLIWAQRFGSYYGEQSDQGTSVTTDAAGNIFVAGQFYGSVAFGSFTLTSMDGSDGFVMKLSPDGTVLWAKQFAGAGNMNIKAGTVAVGNDGYVYVAGGFVGTLDADPGPGEVWLGSVANAGNIFMIRLDADGNYAWGGTVGSSAGAGSICSLSLAVNADAGNWEMYIGGNFTGTIDFDPGTGTYNLTESANSDACLFKISNGQFAWAKKYGAAGIDMVQGVWYHTDGYLYTSKYYGLYNSLTRVEIQKIDPANGNAVWSALLKSAKTTDAITCGDLCLDAAGNLFVNCLYRGKIDFNPGTGTYYLTNPATFDGNPCLLKLTNSGAFSWVFEFKVGCCSDTRGLAIDGSDNIIILGQHSLPIDCDPGSGTFYLNTGIMDAMFQLKLRKTGTVDCLPPSAIQALNIEHNMANIYWNNYSGAAGYNLRYRQYEATEWIMINNAVSGLTLSGLSSGSTYEYQVQSICNGVPGEWSTLSWFKTIVEGCISTGEPNNSLATATAISVGTTVPGLINSFTDTDWYKFSNTSAQKKINLLLYNLPDYYKMQLIKPNGSVIATSTTNEDGSESIVYTKGAAGTYYIKVYGPYNQFNQTECYSLVANIYKSAEIEPEEAMEAETALRLYPNPAVNQLNIDYISAGSSVTVVCIYDMTGRLLKKTEFAPATGENSFTVDIENLPGGICFFELVQGEFRDLRKMVIIR